MEEKYTKGFKKEFTYNGTLYIIDVKPYVATNEEERKQFNLQEGYFLVHLFDQRSITSLILFIDDSLQWNTNSQLIIDDEDLLEKIGFLIDDHYA